jgi:transcriptional regulator with XRE-family HTH domain
MSYFNGRDLRRLRHRKRMSLTDVYEATGISRSQLSRIENGKSDPRMSTVTRLLTVYGATLSDVEGGSSKPVNLSELKVDAQEAAEKLVRFGIGPSIPGDRLARKSIVGHDVEPESNALATRR